MRRSLNITIQRGLALLTCLVLISTAGCASRSRAPSAKRVKKTAAAVFAQEWVELLDAGKYDQAFEQKPLRYRVSSTRQQFERYMLGRRVPFGRALSRKFIAATFTTKMVGLPDGEYETILFKTGFENKAAAAERVILTKEAGRRYVLGYRVY